MHVGFQSPKIRKLYLPRNMRPAEWTPSPCLAQKFAHGIAHVANLGAAVFHGKILLFCVN